MEELKQKTISYSQFTLHAQCPRRWKLDYIDNKRVYQQTIHTLFGTCFHNTIQNYLHVLFNESVKVAESIDLNDYLKKQLMSLYAASVEDGNHYTTPQELSEFYNDGVAILDYFKKKRSVFFNTKHHKLMGIEEPLRVELQKNIVFLGFIDIIIKDTRDDTYIIFDIKTSTAGWNKYQKADKTKTAQLLLYKEYYAKKLGVDVESIDVEYLIVRRKINEDLEFTPKRIQTFVPASGKPSRNKVQNMLNEFIDNCFTDEGEYKLDANYPAIKTSKCKYCPYVNDETLCPKKERKTVADE